MIDDATGTTTRWGSREVAAALRASPRIDLDPQLAETLRAIERGDDPTETLCTAVILYAAELWRFKIIVARALYHEPVTIKVEP